MHEFEVQFTDLSPARSGRGTSRKATVCDLCHDLPGENDEPSCVYACPHDAAHRVDGQSFFNDLVLGQGGKK